MSSRLKKLINDQGLSVSEDQAQSIFSKVKSKNRIITRSWDILSNELSTLGYAIKTRDSQDICAKILGHRNRHILVSTENKADFPIKLWMHLEGVLKNQFLHFAYLSWYLFEASDTEKSILNNLDKKSIKVSRSSLEKGFKELSISYLNQFKNQSLPSDMPSYLIPPKNNFFLTNKINSLTSQTIDYSIFDIDLKKLDHKKIGKYYISLPKETLHVVLGGYLAENCMSVCGDKEYTKIKNNLDRFNSEGTAYLDAHIIDDTTGSLVGILALDEIFRMRANGHLRRSLFVNKRNGMNSDLEKELHSLVYYLFGVSGEFPRIKSDQEVGPLNYKETNSLPHQLEEAFVSYFKDFS